jgi:hypothetical protein
VGVEMMRWLIAGVILLVALVWLTAISEQQWAAFVVEHHFMAADDPEPGRLMPREPGMEG